MVEPGSPPAESSAKLTRETAGQDGAGRFYPPRHQQLKHWIAVPVSVVLILLSAAAFLYGLFTTWTAIERHGRAVLLKTLPLPLLVAVLCAAVGLTLLITTARHWQDGITLLPTGLLFQDGKQTKAVPFTSITRLDSLVNVVKFATSIVDVHTRAVIEDSRGQRFVITDRTAKAQDLVNRCRTEVLPRLHQETQNALQHGKTVTFHPNLAATRQAILIRNMPYDWQDLTVAIQKRRIALLDQATQRERISLPVQKIKNVDILLALFENPPR